MTIACRPRFGCGRPARRGRRWVGWAGAGHLAVLAKLAILAVRSVLAGLPWPCRTRRCFWVAGLGWMPGAVRAPMFAVAAAARCSGRSMATGPLATRSCPTPTAISPVPPAAPAAMCLQHCKTAAFLTCCGCGTTCRASMPKAAGSAATGSSTSTAMRPLLPPGEMLSRLRLRLAHWAPRARRRTVWPYVSWPGVHRRGP